MKRLNYIFALMAALLCVMVTSCHSNEQNYKQAYDKAMEKYKTGVGAEAYDLLQAERMRATMVVNGDSVRLLRMYANVYADSAKVAKKYNVIIAEFTQQINATTMRNRLRTEEGFPSYVLYGGKDKKYYVVVKGFDDIDVTAAFVKEIDKNVKMPLLVPRAWILQKL